MVNNQYIVIMAGGIGSRFWPSSTSEKPKQFLDILGIGKSLIRMTFERSLRIVPAGHIIVMTNQIYKNLVMEHLPELAEANVLCEPSMNNTAPCIAYAALRLKALNPESIFAVLPSDHVILREDEYIKIIKNSFQFAAENDVLVTLGIQPVRPDTGYGYIQYEKNDSENHFYKVTSFKEKPDSETAKNYINSGNYLWNAGMFIWKLSSLLKAYGEHARDIMDVLSQDIQNFGTAGEQKYIDRVYPNTRKISLDYAIMEKAENVYTIPADIGWSDLGTWNSLHQYLAGKDNLVTIGQNIHLYDCEDVIVRSDNVKTIVIKGLKNYIVVDEDNGLLVYPKNEEQHIKQVISALQG
jgi:mannose-1-phosphate guanylyltransferase